MCKYCEEVSYKTPNGICYGGPVEQGEIWWINAEQHFHWQGYEDVLVIQFCPWCGRRLGVPGEEDFSAEDEIARLEEEINHANLRISNLCASLDSYLDHLLSNGTASLENRNQTRQAIQHIRDN